MSNGSKIGKRLTSAASIRKLISSPTWSVKSFFERPQSSSLKQVEEPQLLKCLQLAGLSADITAERNKALLKSLNSQLVFLEHLQSFKVSDSLPLESRILPHHRKPLTFDALCAEVENQQRSQEKGETGEWDPLGLVSERNKSDGFFVFREGLIRK